MGPIMDGAGLNITVLSYRDHIDIGFLADADLVPDIWEVAAQVEPAFEELSHGRREGPDDREAGCPVTPTAAAAAARNGRPQEEEVDQEGRPGSTKAATRPRRHHLGHTSRPMTGSVRAHRCHDSVQHVLVSATWPTTSQTSSNTPSTSCRTACALVDGDARLTYRELDERANRFGSLTWPRSGVGPADHVGIYAQNSHEWLEAMLGCLKIRAVPINVNYRYVEDELSYLIGNAELVGLRLRSGVRRPRRPTSPTARRSSPRSCTSRTAPAPTPSALGSVAFEDAVPPRAHPSATSLSASATTSTSSTPAARPACPRA